MCVTSAALYVPTGTPRPVAERIAAAGLAWCDDHDLPLAALVWRPASAAGLVLAGVVSVVVATRPYPDLQRLVVGAHGRLVVLRVGRQPRRSGLGDTVSALLAAGRIDPATAAELLAADGGSDPGRALGPDPTRRPRRTGR